MRRPVVRRRRGCYNGRGMRTITSLALVTGTACNFSCPYCRQPRDGKRLRWPDVERFLAGLRPRLADTVRLGFHGGEPLLHWPLLERTVRRAAQITGRRFRFALTSNGSLLRRQHILFCREHGVDLGLSYDGLAQRQRDPGSVAAVERALRELLRLYPGGYVVLGVFSPRTLPLLAASMAELLRRGHARLRFALDAGACWRRDDLAVFAAQLRRLAALCRRHLERTGVLPLENFHAPGAPGLFACDAGRGRLALLPDRTVWGCERIAALAARAPENPALARFRLGGLDELAAATPRRTAAFAARTASLRQDFFLVGRRRLCALCPELDRCAICPATAAFAGGALGLLPAWTCRSARLVRRAAGRVHAAGGGG